MNLCCCFPFWPKKLNSQDIELMLLNKQNPPRLIKKNTSIKEESGLQINQRNLRWVDFKLMLDQQFQEYRKAIAAQTYEESRDSQINYIANRLHHIKFTVKGKPKVSIVQGSKKYYYQLESKSGTSKWTSFMLFGELYDLALLLSEFYDVKKKPFVRHLLLKVNLEYFPTLTPLKFTSNIEEVLIDKVSEIQQWFDQLTKEPYFLNEALLKAINCPAFILVGFKTYQQTVDSQYSCIDDRQQSLYKNNFRERQSHPLVVVDYTYDIKMVQVDCYSYERCFQLRSIQSYLIKFYVKLAKQELLWECKKTWSEIKEIHQKLEEIVGAHIPYMRLYLSAYEESESNEKQYQIDKYLKALFSSQQYYCDMLFDEYGLVGQLMSQPIIEEVDNVEDQVIEDFRDDFILPQQKFRQATNEDLNLSYCTIRVRRILRINKVTMYELSFSQYNDTYDNKVLEVIVMYSFSQLHHLQRSISQIYEGLVYKLSSRLVDESQNGKVMKLQIESFFLNILQLPQIKSHKPFMDCFHLWWIKEQTDRQMFYDFCKMDV